MLLSASSTLVPVLMLLYNDGVYCTKYLPSFMHAMAIGLAHYGFRPRFYFYDNSTDGTPDGLAQLARDFDARSSTRCNRIAACRNALMGMALNDVRQAKLVLLAVHLCSPASSAAVNFSRLLLPFPPGTAAFELAASTLDAIWLGRNL